MVSPFNIGLAAASLVPLVGSLFGKDGSQFSGEQKQLFQTQAKLADDLAEQIRKRFAIEDQYMPQTLATVQNYMANQLNKPRSQLIGHGIFEPRLMPRNNGVPYMSATDFGQGYQPPLAQPMPEPKPPISMEEAQAGAVGKKQPSDDNAIDVLKNEFTGTGLGAIGRYIPGITGQGAVGRMPDPTEEWLRDFTGEPGSTATPWDQIKNLWKDGITPEHIKNLQQIIEEQLRTYKAFQERGETGNQGNSYIPFVEPAGYDPGAGLAMNRAQDNPDRTTGGYTSTGLDMAGAQAGAVGRGQPATEIDGIKWVEGQNVGETGTPWGALPPGFSWSPNAVLRHFGQDPHAERARGRNERQQLWLKNNLDNLHVSTDITDPNLLKNYAAMYPQPDGTYVWLTREQLADLEAYLRGDEPLNEQTPEQEENAWVRRNRRDIDYVTATTKDGRVIGGREEPNTTVTPTQVPDNTPTRVDAGSLTPEQIDAIRQRNARRDDRTPTPDAIAAEVLAAILGAQQNEMYARQQPKTNVPAPVVRARR